MIKVRTKRKRKNMLNVAQHFRLFCNKQSSCRNNHVLSSVLESFYESFNLQIALNLESGRRVQIDEVETDRSHR